IKETDIAYDISGSSFSVTLDKKTGLVTSYKMAEQELLHKPITPNFWRAITDNDYGAYVNQKSAEWRHASSNRTLTFVEVVQKGDIVVIKTAFQLPTTPASKVMLTYTIHPSGQVEVEQLLQPGENTSD